MHFEGTLHKWTNYVSGWQSRWFVLDGGVLSYYLSAEDVRLGCRGSVRMASCALRAPPNDELRLDIILPGDRYIYVKAATREERQRWLVALGNARRDNPEHSVRYMKVMELHWQCQKVINHVTNLRRFMQSHTYNTEDLTKMERLLSESCDQFLNNLADCMETMGVQADNGQVTKSVSDSTVTSPVLMPHSTNHDSLLDSSFVSEQPPEGDTPSHLIPETHSVFHTPSFSGSSSTHPSSVNQNSVLDSTSKILNSDSNFSHQAETPSSSSADQGLASLVAQEPYHPDSTTSSNSQTNSQVTTEDMNSAPHQKQQQQPQQRTSTFFSKLPHKFSEVLFLADSGIPTDQFLKACEDTLPFFNLLSATAFAPVKADINGNITKLRRKYDSNQKQFVTLQAMVHQELQTGTHNAKDSATDALLWLKRAMEFIQVFLSEVAAGEHDLAVAAGKAYSKSLRQHHNWVVRGLFALAVKAVPYHDQFVNMLGTSEETVMADMQQFSVSLQRLLVVIKKLYTDQQLDN